MSSCNPDKIRSALYEETENITDIVREKIKTSDRLALRMVPDGGVVRRNQNNDSVIYGEARQAPIAYRSVDHSERALVEGTMTGQDQRGQNGIFETDINEIDDNACHGQVTIDFSQGYRIRRTRDYELSVDTPVKCARELDRLGREHIIGYFKGFRNQFTRWGLDNFSDNLLNLCIQYSEANASVIAGNQFNVTTGGWQAPPQKRITIHFLQDYRLHIMNELKGRGMEVPEDWFLEVEMPREDWIDAVRMDQITRNGTGTVYNTEWLKDDEGPMRGRQMAVYGGIKCYFNETPIRGYFKRVGTVGGNDNFRFVRVYDWKNSRDEVGGIATVANHDYHNDTIVVDGISYPMVTLIPHIDPRSFKRYGLVKPIKPIGDDNAGVNYEVRVIDGANLGCNDFNDKFKLAARHEFRFKAMYPEFSGFIAYRHSRRAGYELNVNNRDYTGGPDTPALPEQFRVGHPDNCQQAECAQCDKITDENGQCIEQEDAENSVLRLLPAGAVTAAVFGANTSVTFTVERSGALGAPASVAYATANGTASSGSDYTATSGTLSWDAYDNEPKTITVPVLAAADDGQTFTLTISGASGATIATGAAVATVTINQL
jgi:hypothetical protein